MRHRTVLRIHNILDMGDTILVEATLSGWKPHRKVLLGIDVFPEGFLGALEHSPGPDECTMYLRAEAELAAEKGAELDLQGPWSLERVRLHDDPSHPLGVSVEKLDAHSWDKDGKIVY